MEHLRELLKSHQVTQTQLAQVLGRDKSAITNLLQGKRQLKAQEVVKIAEYLGVSESQVLGIEPQNGLSESQRIRFSAPPSLRMQQSQQVVQEAGQFYLDLDAGDKENAYKRYAVEVKDEALNLSGLLVGDVVISEMGLEVRPGDIVVIQQYVDSGAQTILRKYQPPFLMPHSTIPTYEKLHEERESIRMVSPVVQIIRMLR